MMLHNLHRLSDRMMNMKAAEDISVMRIERRNDYQCVMGTSKMEDLIDRAMEQNFVQVVDDRGQFIGIITRRDIIGYCYKNMRGREEHDH